jgi:hypothetical protein
MSLPIPIQRRPGGRYLVPTQEVPTVPIPEVPAVPAVAEENITEEQITELLSTVTRYNPPVEFNDYIKTKFRDYIRKNWLTRPGHKSLSQLIFEMEHPCTEDFFQINSNRSQDNLNDKMDRLMKEIELNPNVAKEIEGMIDMNIEQHAVYFIEGYPLVLKDNLVFENGQPIGVQGGDRTRFRKCNEVLTRQKTARNAVAPRVDETAKAFALRKVRAAGEVIREFKAEQRRQQQEAITAEFAARGVRALANTNAEVARIAAAPAAKLKEGAARTIALDLVDIPLSYLPKKKMFSNPRVTFVYQSLMGRISGELVNILVTKDESEFAALKEKYARELRSDCFQDLLISTINQIIKSKP